MIFINFGYEEVELLPAGLVTCLINKEEVRIVKISPKKLQVRLSEKVSNINEIKMIFYNFHNYKYDELIINEYILVEKVAYEFYYVYVISINEEKYMQYVRRAFRQYSNYIRLKVYGDNNEFSKEMVNYPAELDYDLFESYGKEKKQWLLNINYLEYQDSILDAVELAISIDNNILYKKYIEYKKDEFIKYYLKKNYIENHKLATKKISRLYIGNQFCHNLFPEIDLLISILNKSKREKFNITLAFTYIRECYIKKNKEVIDRVYRWCIENDFKIEIIINDWGMLSLIKDKGDYIKISLGVLLNKRKKDPRYIYKRDCIENKRLMAKNSLNSLIYSEFLKSNNIERYEYEGCGYKIDIAKGNNSLHLPYYVTNTSQYCPLYARCKTMDRGKQKLVTECPNYCNTYVLSYPRHLRMVGRYNSLFAFDDMLLKDFNKLKEYLYDGIDRIVLNFI